MDSKTTDFNAKVVAIQVLIGRGKPAGKELFGSGIEVYAKSPSRALVAAVSTGAAVDGCSGGGSQKR